ncbi:pilus assembly protein N-terminal domain-containing protein [Bradyrhizobium sp. CW1]|uniref:pilus assembly protein N-terminal domain-containing protein n=1 Tax=Bradyrhizobium sp. CW1 TaxID=2782686 RepID=UPI0020001AB0|nr:pilus assembly protein N-terminal domain-containing protein [Bradyrhizobium sp. CW1]UPJ25406.1 pilus assembly protein N-terminal domain-containing protein [Bradyrhizobium sp. CW1]
MSARFLSQWAFAIFATVGVSTALAQERAPAISVGEEARETVQLRPGFQQELTLPNGAIIGSIHVGDPNVVHATPVSDRRFLITGLPPKENGSAPAAATRATNVLVLDNDKKVVAKFEVVVGYFQNTHLVEIHKRIGGNKTAGGGQTEVLMGVEKYQCSPTKCDLVFRDKAELPIQFIQQDVRQQNININGGSPNQ